MALRAVVDNRGIRMPFVLLLMSSMADACGDALSLVILTCPSMNALYNEKDSKQRALFIVNAARMVYFRAR